MTDTPTAPAPSGGTPSAQEIQDWIVAKLQQQADEIDVDIQPDQPLTTLGIDSMQFIGLIGDLEEWLGCRIVDNPLPVYPTITSLSAWLAGELQAGKTQLDPFAKSP